MWIIALVAVTLLLLCVLIVRNSSESYDRDGDSFKFPNMFDYREEATAICDTYNDPSVPPPSKQEDCPDSSFAFVAAPLTKVYVGEDHPSCMQIQPLAYPNCYSDSQGKYKPWFNKIDAFSP
jgi:hypothetical protein